MIYYVVIILRVLTVLTQDYSCYDFKFRPRVCLPGPEDITSRRMFTASPNMTCGSPPSGYCRTAQPSGCYICNSTAKLNSHPVSYSTDKNFPFVTWWQSITWWDAMQHSLLINEVLKTQLTLSMNKSYDLTGSIKVTFHSSRPNAFIFEKSSDFGNSWIPYRYYADNCGKRFGVVPKITDIRHPRDIHCTEVPNIRAAKGAQISFQPYYTTQNFWTNETQEYLKATDIRISLLYPWTDGYEMIKQKAFLNRYYYDISDIQIHGRCHCNGHAPYCIGSDVHQQRCYCQHNTDGVDCDRCLPLYNNKPWKPAESNVKPNPCEVCECHNHSYACLFNSTLLHGVCDSCLNGTTGDYCELCKEDHFRNTKVSLTHPETCLQCDCYLDGVVDNGQCVSNKSSYGSLGQCFCKPFVKGRQCDRCQDGYFGLKTLKRNCSACDCSTFGTLVNRTLKCDQLSGQCNCKNTTSGRKCSICKSGFYGFPNSTNEECKLCKCNIGGAIHNICNASSGHCNCRYGIVGHHCGMVSAGRFFPGFDYFLYEAESGSGNFTVHTDLIGSSSFTGLGFALLEYQDFVRILFTVDVTGRYFLGLRYISTTQQILISSQMWYINQSVSFPMFYENILVRNQSISWQKTSSIFFISDVEYMLHLTLNSTGRLLLDSVLLMIDLQNTKLYQQSGHKLKEDIEFCWKKSLEANNSYGRICENITFASTVEWFNGSVECGCNKTGSVSNTTCQFFGGQCLCKPGITGRKCDQCKPGFFNYTQNGCTECSCNKTGSKNLICEQTTGACECKANVMSRTCDRCQPYFYGFSSATGCQPCKCNKNGSSNLQCSDSGKCLCYESVKGYKCDQCREKYFNFSVNGCSSCDCDVEGSAKQQCNVATGLCSCKPFVVGDKCNTCKPHFFNLNEHNLYGCQECFCFNKTTSCVSADGFLEKTIPFRPHAWLPRGTTSTQTSSNCIHINSTQNVFAVRAPVEYTGNLLALHRKSVTATLISGVENALEKESFVILKITALNKNQTVSFGSNMTSFGRNRNTSFYISNENTFDKLTTIRLQSILVNVTKMEIVFNQSVFNLFLCDVKISTIERSQTGVTYFNGVEKCACPNNYTGLSCERCAPGYTREVSNPSGWGNCVLCQCNGRSELCDPQSGVCLDCRHGTTGDHCEKCQPLVEGPDCLHCVNGSYGFNITNFFGCRPCDCYSKNTVNGKENTCDMETGQCPCKDTIGGRKCDECAENFVNITNQCKPCSECHRLIQDEVHLLRKAVKHLQRSVQNSTTVGQSLFNDSISSLLSNMSVIVMDLRSEANSSYVIERELIRNLSMLNQTFEKISSFLVENVTEKVNLIRHQAPEILIYENTSRHTINLIYGMLWASDFILNGDIQSAVNTTTSKLYELQLLGNNFTSLKSEFENTSKLFLEDSNLIFEQTALLKNNMTVLKELVENMSGIENNTRSELTDLSKSLHATNILVHRLMSDSTRLLNATKQLFFSINQSYTDSLHLSNLTSNMSALFAQKLSAENQTQLLADRLKGINQSHTRTISFVTSYLNASKHVKARFNERFYNHSMAIEQISNAHKVVNNATRSANESYQGMLKILHILKMYREQATNLTKSVNESLLDIQKVNISSLETLKKLKNINKSLKMAVSNASDALNFSTMAFDQITRQQKILQGELRRSILLLNHSHSLNNRNTSRQAIMRNFTGLKQKVDRDKEQCNNISRHIHKAANHSVASRQIAIIKLREEQKQQYEFVDIMKEIQSLKTMNHTRLLGLQQKLKKSRERFDSLSIKEAIKHLRERSVEQKDYIRYYKEQVNLLKDEIRDLKTLYKSMRETKTCN